MIEHLIISGLSALFMLYLLIVRLVNAFDKVRDTAIDYENALGCEAMVSLVKYVDK